METDDIYNIGEILHGNSSGRLTVTEGGFVDFRIEQNYIHQRRLTGLLKKKYHTQLIEEDMELLLSKIDES
jgi:hypothetical protein